MIRPASLADLPALMEIEQACFQEDCYNETLYLSFFRQPGTEVHVLTSGERIAGSLILMVPAREKSCHIVSVAVLPEYQGAGLGKELMNHAECRARERNCRWIRLEVRCTNQRARSFYRSLGYTESLILRNYYGRRADGVFCMKNLS